jgi:hypothetical protein
VFIDKKNRLQVTDKIGNCPSRTGKNNINMDNTIPAGVIRALEYEGIICWLKLITLGIKYNN